MWKPECTLHMHNIMNKYRKKVYYKLHDDQHDFFYQYRVSIKFVCTLSAKCTRTLWTPCILFSPDRYVSFSLVFMYSIAPFNISKRKLSLANVMFLFKTSDVQFAICSNLLCYIKDSQKKHSCWGTKRFTGGHEQRSPTK